MARECMYPPQGPKNPKGSWVQMALGMMDNPFPRDQIKHIKLYRWDGGSDVRMGLYVKEEAYPVLFVKSHSTSNSKPRAVHDIQRH